MIARHFLDSRQGERKRWDGAGGPSMTAEDRDGCTRLEGVGDQEGVKASGTLGVRKSGPRDQYENGSPCECMAALEVQVMTMSQVPTFW